MERLASQPESLRVVHDVEGKLLLPQEWRQCPAVVRGVAALARQAQAKSASLLRHFDAEVAKRRGACACSVPCTMANADGRHVRSPGAVVDVSILNAAAASAKQKQETDARSGDPNQFEAHRPTAPRPNLATLGMWQPVHAKVSNVASEAGVASDHGVASDDGSPGGNGVHPGNVSPTGDNRSSAPSDSGTVASRMEASSEAGCDELQTVQIDCLPPVTAAACARVDTVTVRL